MTSLAHHLSLILAGLAAGRSDVVLGADEPAKRETTRTMAALGATVIESDSDFSITGTGNGCLLRPADPLVFELDPRPALLMIGLLSAYDMESRVQCHQPIDRADIESLAAALPAMGAQLEIKEGEPWSVSIGRQPSLHPVAHDAQGWSDVVVAAALLAGLNTPGRITLKGLSTEPVVFADLLTRFGVSATIAGGEATGWSIAIEGQGEIRAAHVELVA